MKSIICSLILISSISLHAQEKTPNYEVKELGLNQESIYAICSLAAGKLSNTESIWTYHPVLEYVFITEERYPPENKGFDFDKYFKELWNKKYSKCYCDLGTEIYGTLDAMAIYSGNLDWVYQLYDVPLPHMPMEVIPIAEINRVTYLNHRTEQLGTLLDYIYKIRDENPIHKVKQDPSFKDELVLLEKRLRRAGAKRHLELTEKEIASLKEREFYAKHK